MEPQTITKVKWTSEKAKNLRGSRMHVRKPLRRGIATVEMAVVLPLLLILVLGTIEICQRLFLRQTAVVATYEGIRLAARKSSNPADIVNRCQSILANRRVTGATVTVSPATFKDISTGSPITVEIKVPWAANTATRFVLKDQGQITVKATMLRE